MLLVFEPPLAVLTLEEGLAVPKAVISGGGKSELFKHKIQNTIHRIHLNKGCMHDMHTHLKCNLVNFRVQIDFCTIEIIMES